MITTRKELEDKVYEEYRKYDTELNALFFDFNVSMPIMDILDAYAEIQWAINGDWVAYPYGVEGTYTGNCMKFLLSCTGKQGYARIAEHQLEDFIW